MQSSLDRKQWSERFTGAREPETSGQGDRVLERKHWKDQGGNCFHKSSQRNQEQTQWLGRLTPLSLVFEQEEEFQERLNPVCHCLTVPSEESSQIPTRDFQFSPTSQDA